MNAGVRIVVQLFALESLDLVIANVLPHDVGDRGSDQAEVEFDLDPDDDGLEKLYTLSRHYQSGRSQTCIPQ